MGRRPLGCLHLALFTFFLFRSRLVGKQRVFASAQKAKKKKKKYGKIANVASPLACLCAPTKRFEKAIMGVWKEDIMGREGNFRVEEARPRPGHVGGHGGWTVKVWIQLERGHWEDL